MEERGEWHRMVQSAIQDRVCEDREPLRSITSHLAVEREAAETAKEKAVRKKGKGASIFFSGTT